MAKKKTAPLFQSWDEVNQALREISVLDAQVSEAEAKMNALINDIKADTEAVVTPLLQRKAELEAHIQAFTESRIDEFKDSKTKTLTFGEVGFRKTTSIITRNVKAILEALKQNKMFDCISVKESIDKDELAKYDDAALAKVGAKRDVKEKFFYKPTVERIEAQ
ncbi:host-nuclease inhibitor Gam family protein [Brevibacillus thermoruber]|uniref:host-nuclease inhibitor Gam family protein n=1 Tax=Brevibacillus thermoruber TaxID=33942 RepID=UPI00054DBBDA|nr:host-nuclease inhibitor Gam family protein [Brevibacillus thermoruber]